MGDTAVVVTRYFGGTKLGTGGLVRAYGDAVRQVLLVTRSAVKAPILTVSITIPYHLNDTLRRQLPLRGVEIQDAQYGSEVTLTGRLLRVNLPLLQATLQDLSGGTVQAQELSFDADAIVPQDAPLFNAISHDG